LDELLTVEEVSSRLNISTATVKRLLHAGKLQGEKAGRAWVVRADSLPKQYRASRKSGSTTGRLRLDEAILHLRGQDLRRDLWVPDLLRYEDDLAEVALLTSAASAKIDGQEPPDPQITVAVPKSSFFLRNAANLTLSDRLAYHAIVANLLPQIEKTLSDDAFAARASDKPGSLLVDGTKAWLKWRAAVRKELEAHDGWMAETDITAFFDFIRHGQLLLDLQRLPADPRHIDILRDMLRTWSDSPDMGVPQGPDASRVLANFYLAPVDQAMRNVEGIRYFRYMDDIRIVGQNRSDIVRALQLLDQECRRRGLALSTKKTSVHRGVEAIQRLSDQALDVAAYAFELEKDTPHVRQKLRALFNRAVARPEEINERHAKFSLFRLFQLRDSNVRKKVLDNLENLGPLGWILPAYLNPWFRNGAVQRDITHFLTNPERNTSEYISSWLLAGMLSQLIIPAEWVNYARRVGMSRERAPHHRALALNVLALGRQTHDITQLEDIVRKDWEPEIVRAALIALYRISKLSRSISGVAVRRFPALSTTVSYLRGRRDLPSLIFAGERVRLSE
jgi:excisionase family DNA binding protein